MAVYRSMIKLISRKSFDIEIIYSILDYCKKFFKKNLIILASQI